MPTLVSLTFDDGFRCQFEKALPILNKYGMPATFFLIANRDSTHDRWSGHLNDWWKIDWCEDDIVMLKALVRDGHEIGSHSVTHDPNKMQRQPEVEARESKKLIEGWLGTTVSSFCYPFYRSHRYLANAVKDAGYDQARGGGLSPFYRPQSSYYAVPDSSLDRFNIDCREISVNENVGGWVRPGCWHILTFHGIGSDQDGWAPISVEQFAAQMAELAKLRNSGAVEVVTFKDGATRLRQ
jgi:peptidoglycan/xylan/chitin deacetylase (PgdA/CDA1 family)